MNDGDFLREYIENKHFRVTTVVQLTGIKRPTIYTHFKKNTLDTSIKKKYFDGLGIKWPDVDEQLLDTSKDSGKSDSNDNITNREKGREMQDANQFTHEHHGQPTKDIDVRGGAIPAANKDNKGVPYYDIDFMGGFDLIFNDQQIKPSFYIDFLPFNDCDCWINVTGKSMGPLIAHGDIVGLKKVDNWNRFLLEGEIYAVITDNGFRTIKMIGAGPDKDHYTLIPYNKSEEYKPQVIPKDVITHIFRVKGNIKKFF